MVEEALFGNGVVAGDMYGPGPHPVDTCDGMDTRGLHLYAEEVLGLPPPQKILGLRFKGVSGVDWADVDGEFRVGLHFLEGRC